MVISLDVSVSVKNERTRTDLFKSTSSCSELAEKKSTVVLQDYSPIEPLKRGKIYNTKTKIQRVTYNKNPSKKTQRGRRKY